ncbi:uncharacterized protein LOC124918828 [Impatiens glandulifera]|uniref:uncharacterized protein LOC124918828 n=1 Tax=Impatiens glandulifera TaxID=253017 RepID=UPI001FB10344|nr:uncharacterized protein LOC124918828 [Impatiens glandulifera]
MPTFTAIALDRLIDPATSKSMKSVSDFRMERRNAVPDKTLDIGLPPPNPKMGRRRSSTPTPSPTPTNTVTSASSSTIDKKHHWAQITPALYATPVPTPVPDTPSSSFPPSPYIINHKRRGPRLVKSLSVDDVSIRKVEGEKEDQGMGSEERDVGDHAKDVISSVSLPSSPTKKDNLTANCSLENSWDVLRIQNLSSSSENHLPMENVLLESAPVLHSEHKIEVDGSEDSKEPTSSRMNVGEKGIEVDSTLSLTTPAAEFYDAWDELASEGSGQQLSSQLDIESELRDIRSSLLMETEKRKQAEEATENMRIQWKKLQQQLSCAGLFLPVDPLASQADQEQLGVDPAEDLCQQLYVVRLVSNSIGRATAKAEVENETKAQMELKNFEIARLWDKLRYYESVNHEMSQRNQEAVEIARRLRQRRKRRHRWIWGSFATATVVIGTGVLGWSYLSSSSRNNGLSSSSNQSSVDADQHPATK